MSEAPKTVWVTKYALTEGVKECDVLRMDADGYARIRWDTGFTKPVFLRDYRVSRKAALIRANEMKAAKIASLKRQIEKLEALEF